MAEEAIWTARMFHKWFADGGQEQKGDGGWSAEQVLVLSHRHHLLTDDGASGTGAAVVCLCWADSNHSITGGAGRAMETGTAAFSCCKPAARPQALKPCFFPWCDTEQPKAAKELFDMAQLLQGLILPSHPIISLGIWGFCSPQQLSRHGLHTAFPLHCVLISAAANPCGKWILSSYCALFPGLFIPAIIHFDGPSMQKQKLLETFVLNPVLSGAFYAF